MTLNGKTHNLLKDRKILIPALLVCVLFSFAFLACSKKEQPVPARAKALMEKGDSCRLVWKYNKALSFYQQAYDDPAVANDVTMQLQLLERIMRTHDVLRHWKEMPESSYRLYMLAKEHGDSVHTAMALLMRGKRLHSLGQKQEGLKVALRATEMLKHTNYAHKDHELGHFYAILANMYFKDGNYDEALRMSQKQEQHVKLARKCHPDEWYRRNLERTYIIRMGILAKMGRMDEADSIYQQFDIKPCTTDPLCSESLLSYYRLRGMYDEVQQFLNIAMRNITEDGDTIGRNMQLLLRDMGDFHFGQGDYQRAAELYAGTSRIADTLAARSLSNLTVEVQKVIDNERDIAKHQKRLYIIISVLALLIVVFLLSLRQSLIARKRNKKMTVLISQLMHYRNIAIQNEKSDEMGKNKAVGDADEELLRFKEVDKRIVMERLFANPDFGRDDLMRLLGVDKNALPALLQRIAKTNVAGYIGIKRMEYAVSLMKEHPEFTLESIADACGIKSPATFIRNFKAVYDMTPSEYRKQLNLD